MDLEQLFEKSKVESISGRYLPSEKIVPVLENLNNPLEILGYSVLGLPIYKFQIGTGETKILLWSQMHGNESTTTKGLLDFLHFLNGTSKLAKKFLEKFLPQFFVLGH